MRRLKPQHVTAVAVAVSCFALALANGGFDGTTFAVAALAVWLGVILLLGIGLVPRAEPPVAARVAGLCLAGLVAFTALSILWGSDAGHAFEDVVRMLLYVGVFVLVVIACGRGQARPWINGLAIALAAVAAVALLARYEPSLFGNPDADLAERLPAAVGRLTYPIGYWNGLAAVMATAVLLLTWLGVFAGSRAGRAAAAGAMPLAVLALWMTDSRGGVVAAAIAFVILAATSLGRARLAANLLLGSLGGVVLILCLLGFDELRDQPTAEAAAGQGDAMLAITLALVAAVGTARWWLDPRLQGFEVSRQVAVGVVAAAAVGALALLVLSDPIERIDDFKEPPQAVAAAEDVGLLRGGGSGRYQFWEAAVNAFEDRPVAGQGAAGYTPYWLEHREIAIPATRAHSLLFETLAELGLVGFALLGGFFATGAVVGWRRARSPGAPPETAPALAAFGVGLAASAVDWTADLPAVFVVVIITAALLTGPGTLVPDGSRPLPRIFGEARSRRRFGAGVVVLLVAWISICAGGLLLLEDRKIESSRDAANRGDLAAALDAANDAADLEPWAAEPHTQQALIYELQGEYAAAQEAIAEAIDRAPRDYQLRLIAARIDTGAGDPASAKAQIAQARTLNPLDPVVRFSQTAG
jgi:O-antigen ligase